MKKKLLMLSIVSLSIFGLSSCIKGNPGNGISTIEKTESKENIDYYTITFTNGSTTTFTVTNGKDGVQGIEGKPGKDGHTPVITIGENGNWFIDGVDSEIKAIGLEGPAGPQGEQGEPGKDGRSIVSINFTNSIDNIDTYTITYSDGNTSTFTVTNGKDGEYGKPGEQGIQGIQGEPGKDGHTPVITIGENGNWFIDGIDTKIKAQGPQGPIGPTGPQGEPGKDGTTPVIGENGNWWINNIDTGYPSRGENGESTSLSINDEGYWVINGETTSFKAEGNVDDIYSAMDHYFDLENRFILEKETLSSPSYSYTTSTFSGWTGSIGRPKSVKTLIFKVRARENPITSVKLYLNKEDKNGSNIVTETLNVTINPFEEKERKYPKDCVNNYQTP